MSPLPARSRAMIGGLAAMFALGLAWPVAAQTEGAPEVEAEADAAPMTEGEKRLAKLLEGRVAGEPVSCIRTMRNIQMQTIDRTAYVYGRGETIYVQRTRSPEQIDSNDTLVTNRFNSSELCRVDNATTIDPFTGTFTGVVFFDDFVPYTRVKADAPGEG